MKYQTLFAGKNKKNIMNLSSAGFADSTASSIFFKNRHFIIQERFNKLIYGIDTIIKCGM